MNPKILGLIKLYQMEQNEEALLTLWEDFRPLIINLMKRFNISLYKQEDVFQDSFIHLLECAKTYDPTGQMPFEGYYKLQLQYWFLNRIRKKCEILSVDYNWSMGVSMTDFMASPLGNGPEILMASETSTELQAAIGNLTAKQRQAVVLFYFHGLSLSKVAQEIGCSYNGAHRHKAAGLRNIREVMG